MAFPLNSDKVGESNFEGVGDGREVDGGGGGGVGGMSGTHHFRNLSGTHSKVSIARSKPPNA